MTNSDYPSSEKPTESPATPAPMAPPAAGDLENQTPGETGTFGVSAIVRRWRREDLLNRVSLGLRGLGLIFSFLAFIIMASNKHGDWGDFTQYEEYKYVLAIAILSTLYTGGQALRQVHELTTQKKLFSPRNLALLDFFGDQISAYLLISAASSAIPSTDRMRVVEDNIFTDTSASAISMEFLAFLALAVSALISGYKLSNQSYI